jgi:hypothetical protein
MSEERFVIRTAAGFSVIAGVKLNAEPLSKAEADRLAGSPAAAPVPDDPAPQPSPPAAATRWQRLDVVARSEPAARKRPAFPKAAAEGAARAVARFLRRQLAVGGVSDDTRAC